jgi:hypothetical protein
MSSRPSIENDRRTDPMSVFPFTPNMSIDAIQPMVANMAQISGKGFTSLMEVHREWTAFLAGRLQQDVALVHSLAKCAAPQEIYSVYAEFFQKAFSDYQREFAEMMRLGQTQLAETTAAAQEVREAATRRALRPAA